MTDHTTTAEQPVPEILVTVYRGGHLVEKRYCQDPETVASIVESLESSPPPDGERLVVEQDSPEMMIVLLRAIADAIEQGRPLQTSHPFPHLRLQLAAEGTEPRRGTRGELLLLWQEQAHPGGRVGTHPPAPMPPGVSDPGAADSARRLVDGPPRPGSHIETDDRGDVMEHESTRLTAEERRIFAEIETALRRDQRRSFHHRLRGTLCSTRRMAAMAVLVGTALLAGGLWFGRVAVAAAGFVAVLVGLSGLVADGVLGRMLGRFRRWLGGDATPGGTR